MGSWQRSTTAVLLFAAVLAVLHLPTRAVGGSDGPVALVPTVTNAGLVPFVQKRLREWQPSPEERRMDEIGWAGGLLEAERLGKAHGRPVFLFTLDGRMELGRC